MKWNEVMELGEVKLIAMKWSKVKVSRVDLSWLTCGPPIHD